MSTKKTNLEKLYTVSHNRDRKWGHYQVTLGSSYSGEYFSYFHHVVTTFQYTVPPEPDDISTMPRCYAGRVEIDLFECGADNTAAMKPIQAALKKAAELSPGMACEYQSLITGLRAIGYREARLGQSGIITSIS